MSVFLLGLVSLMFGIISLIYEILDIKKRKSIRIINVFGLMYCLTYGFFTSIIMLSYEFTEKQFRRIVYTNTMLNSLWVWLVLALVGYFIIRFVYELKPTKPNLKHKSATLESDIRDCQRLLITSLVCLIIGIISLFLWSYAYGGIFELIKVANTVRSGNNEIKNSLAFFKHPARIVTLVSYVSIILIQKKYKRNLNVFLFVVSFIFSILYLFASDGRLSMAMYLVILILIGFRIFTDNTKFNKKIFLLCITAIFALMLIMRMDFITNYIRTGDNLDADSNFVFDSILDEFAYVIVAGQNSSNLWLTEGSPFLIVHDIMSGIFAWFPSFIKPGDFINIWDYNTQSCQMTNLYSGQWPTDFVSTSIYTLGLFGIFVFGAFWGRVIRQIDEQRNNNSLFFDVVYYSLSMAFLRLVDYCMLYNFILGIFYIFVAFVVWKITAWLVPKKQISNNVVVLGE